MKNMEKNPFFFFLIFSEKGWLQGLFAACLKCTLIKIALWCSLLLIILIVKLPLITYILRHAGCWSDSLPKLGSCLLFLHLILYGISSQLFLYQNQCFNKLFEALSLINSSMLVSVVLWVTMTLLFLLSWEQISWNYIGSGPLFQRTCCDFN